MNGFLPDYSMNATGLAKAKESAQRQKTLQQASTDPRLGAELRHVADLSAQELGGQEVGQIDKLLAGDALSRANQMQQAEFQGALKQAASGQDAQQPRQPLPAPDPRNVAGWTKFVRGGPKYLDQFLPQY